jgi:hypothetical protein
MWGPTTRLEDWTKFPQPALLTAEDVPGKPHVSGATGFLQSPEPEAKGIQAPYGQVAEQSEVP